MPSHTPIVPSRRRARYTLATPTNPPKIPAGVVLLRNVVRTTLLSRIGRPWAEVAATIAKLPQDRRQALSKLIRPHTVMRDGQLYYYGAKSRLIPVDPADIHSCGYYICPTTKTLQFTKYEPKIEGVFWTVTGL
jgi:hypothetical protein